jgi:hypothetical protein
MGWKDPTMPVAGEVERPVFAGVDGGDRACGGAGSCEGGKTGSSADEKPEEAMPWK